MISPHFLLLRCIGLPWSYDPDTHDRESIQCEKRFHMHLIGRSRTELAFVRAHARPAMSCPPARRRRICEEASVLGALIVGDLLERRALRAVDLIPPLSTPTATVSVQIRLNKGWAAFADQPFLADLADLHATFSEAYTGILRACAVGAAGRWRRARIRMDADRLVASGLPLRPATRAALSHYVRGLRAEILDRTPASFWRDPSNHEITTHVYPLAGLAYSAGFAEHDGKVFGYLRSNVFSDLGGAGVSVIDGVVVKVRRGAGVMSRRELAARAAFQREYLDRLQCGTERALARIEET